MPKLWPLSSVRHLAFLFFLLALPVSAAAQSPAAEYRALWVETFNTPLGTHADIDKVIDAAVSSNANAIFAQIRRRGDSWYLDTLEPLTQVKFVGEPDATGKWTFDPLQYLIDQAHLRSIEVHAYVIIGAIYNSNPISVGVPADPNHVFNTHFWNGTTRALYPDSDPRQWSTRALPHNLGDTAFNGHRFTNGAEWYIDLGHPEAEAHTVAVLTHLVSRYAIDGLHLDRIRYPEAPIERTSPSFVTAGYNVGYNETSVTRFKARYGSAASYYTTADIGTNVNTYPSTAPPAIISAADVGYPKTNDALWSAWRREQVSNFVRRLYLSATAVNPRIKLSAATICFSAGPTASGGWERTEAYYRVFQDWRGWMQEGTLDIAAPMIYKREHTADRTQFDDWLAFTKWLAQTTGRHAMPGLGAYLNGVEGTLRQARRALARAPFDSGNSAADGVIFYALGSTVPNTLVNNSTNAAVTNNPVSYPTPNQTTPKRTNAEFFAGVRTGANGAAILFEDPGFGPLFPSTAAIPDMPWKTSPSRGHVMGFALNGSVPLDGAIVTIESRSDPALPPRIARTDGGGFYGAVGLVPGTYRARIEQGGTRLDVCSFTVTPGVVTTATAQFDTAAPVTTSTVTAAATGENGWLLGDAEVTLAASDDCSGVALTEYSTDGGSTWTRYSAPFTIAAEGTTVVTYRSVDAAGNSETAASIAIKIDTTAPSVTLASNRDSIWPPNGNMESVTLSGTAADSGAGLAGVSYAVVDEYGGVFTIEPRVLGGAEATWTDAVALEARREGTDLDGRLYRIVATVRDLAGRTASATTQVVVLHDRR